MNIDVNLKRWKFLKRRFVRLIRKPPSSLNQGELIAATRTGDNWALAERLEKLFRTPKMEDKEYKGEFLRMALDLGGEFSDAHYRFTADALTGDWKTNRPVRIYFQVIGLEDVNAPMRNWGMTEKTFGKAHRTKLTFRERLKLFF